VTVRPPALRTVLEAAQRRGWVGPGSLDDIVAHALGFAAGPEPLAAGSHALDLGSGGGVPGLPLALAHPDTTWVLLDSWERRVDALRAAIGQLGLAARATAVHARAEEWGRGPARASADLVVARAFGPPARTAECGAPFLRLGGRLVVSTAPDGGGWPDAVPELGLAARSTWAAGGGTFVSYRLEATVPERFPRRGPAQARGPLF
jgi:16S rRNA G527 N7-methylase RsmG